MTSVASALAFNWFFVPPVHTLTIADTRNWVSLAVFAATAVITSHLAAGFRRQRREAEERRRDAELLEEMAQTVLGQIARRARRATRSPARPPGALGVAALRASCSTRRPPRATRRPAARPR